jgi:hypothetical protein
MVTKQEYRKQELYHSYDAAVIALQDAIKEGWQLDPDNRSEQVGFRYALNLIRDDEPKKTRAEILADARAVKAAKKEGA